MFSSEFRIDICGCRGKKVTQTTLIYLQPTLGI